ncbi:ERCC4 domain-containing protein [Cryptosporidium muris RN66]|uniref:Crossover junction endonuclease MUS81 n=1 Tax=Cryptosporidium muris (strain RN66) TaxID=441375 RepID=B6AJD6_CRYMR|nr:ERCC4 domain-containing protein [Cryptosporidium muris RN66]EEA08274.1 ERCC4 domain-containing protein [Cryptosporidium muris RN66]|eukprot:XP_002142623.1 ERCC4 domain-containing protein [Cryptosporidium muris RN66]
MEIYKDTYNKNNYINKKRISLTDGNLSSNDEVENKEDYSEDEMKKPLKKTRKSINNRNSTILAHPYNIKYLEYLNELRKSAKTMQNIAIIKKAMKSLELYPLPLYNQQQFLSLEGIGNYLASKLSKLINKQESDIFNFDNEEYKDKCKEFREYKIRELNNILEPILQICSEADNKNKNENIEEDKNFKIQKNTSSLRGIPITYGSKWSILVSIYLNEKLGKNSFCTEKSIESIGIYIKNSFSVNMNFKDIEKNIKSLIKSNLIELNITRNILDNFPIGSEQKKYYLTEKGYVVAYNCCCNDSQIVYILKNYLRICENNDLSINEKLKRIALDKTMNKYTDYEIVMIVDYREVNTKIFDNSNINPNDNNDEIFSNNYINNKNYSIGNRSSGIPQYLIKRLCDNGIKIELRSLPVGDIIWVVRPIINKSDDIVPIEKCYVLPWIIERKTGSDLCSSIMDGRYDEQKYRLMRSLGAENIIFLIEDINSIHENIVWSSSTGGPISNGRVPPKQIIRSAQVHTQFVAGFHIVQSQSIGHTITLLIGIHNMISQAVKNRWDQINNKCSNYASPNQDYNETLSLRILENIIKSRPLFCDWENNSKKSSNLTVQQLFGKQLRAIHGCGPEATEILLELWPTPYMIFKEISQTNSVDLIHNQIDKKWNQIKNINIKKRTRKKFQFQTNY